MPTPPARTTHARPDLDSPVGARRAADDLQALAAALDELAGAHAEAPAHARVAGADILLARCRRLVAELGASPGRPARSDRAANPQDAMAHLAARSSGDGARPEWHDWFLTADVRRVRRRR